MKIELQGERKSSRFSFFVGVLTGACVSHSYSLSLWLAFLSGTVHLQSGWNSLSRSYTHTDKYAVFALWRRGRTIIVVCKTILGCKGRFRNEKRSGAFFFCGTAASCFYSSSKSLPFTLLTHTFFFAFSFMLAFNVLCIANAFFFPCNVTRFG